MPARSEPRRRRPLPALGWALRSRSLASSRSGGTEAHKTPCAGPSVPLPSSGAQPRRQCPLTRPRLTRVLSSQVLNVLSSDSYSLFEAALFCPLPATIPVLMGVCAVYAVFILGPTALVGIAVYLVFIPIQVRGGPSPPPSLPPSPLRACLPHAHCRAASFPGSARSRHPPVLPDVLFWAQCSLETNTKLEFEYPGEGTRCASPICQSPGAGCTPWSAEPRHWPMRAGPGPAGPVRRSGQLP